MATELFVKRLSDAAVLPKRGSALAAGWDLASAKAVTVPARGKAIVPTDLAIATPLDCYARIAPRSGLAVKNFIDVGAGVVDADYRGPVGVVLFNHGEVDFEVLPGDRVAQLILEKVHLDVTVTEIAELPETARGAGGFGSTGVAAEEPASKKPRAVSPPGAPLQDAAAQAQIDALQEQITALTARLAALEK
ncbi:dUTPase-like protein [Pelagophyceae sp. CCMP2097]|nr:dUTPase-like protein [Pelagophyceae sp. CCMP2097]|mmetsp:Transcript_9013/g.29780  ORF Transcript_9013/g.29780 Transcript_9013/m.29780 type:complete len:192 (+) Transcript_9013:79-654(+)